MLKRFAVLALLAVLAAIPALAAGPLDGKTFHGTLTEKLKSKTDRDTFHFAEGTFHSTGCDTYGFKPSAYAAEKSDTGWTFTSDGTSPSEGSMAWKGSVVGDMLEGTVVWSKPGQAPIEYTFSAKTKPVKKK